VLCSGLVTKKYAFLLASRMLSYILEKIISSSDIVNPNSSCTSRLNVSKGDSSPSLPPPGRSTCNGKLFVLLSHLNTTILLPIKIRPLTP